MVKKNYATFAQSGFGCNSRSLHQLSLAQDSLSGRGTGVPPVSCLREVQTVWPRRLAARTPDFQSEDWGSSPHGAIFLRLSRKKIEQVNMGAAEQWKQQWSEEIVDNERCDALQSTALIERQFKLRNFAPSKWPPRC